MNHQIVYIRYGASVCRSDQRDVSIHQCVPRREALLDHCQRHHRREDPRRQLQWCQEIRMPIRCGIAGWNFYFCIGLFRRCHRVSFIRSESGDNLSSTFKFWINILKRANSEALHAPRSGSTKPFAPATTSFCCHFRSIFLKIISWLYLQNRRSDN